MRIIAGTAHGQPSAPAFNNAAGGILRLQGLKPAPTVFLPHRPLHADTSGKKEMRIIAGTAHGQPIKAPAAKRQYQHCPSRRCH